MYSAGTSSQQSPSKNKLGGNLGETLKGNGLDQVSVGSQTHGFAHGAITAGTGQHPDGRLARSRISFETAQHFQPSHLWNLQVQQHHLRQPSLPAHSSRTGRKEKIKRFGS